MLKGEQNINFLSEFSLLIISFCNFYFYKILMCSSKYLLP